MLVQRIIAMQLLLDDEKVDQVHFMDADEYVYSGLYDGCILRFAGE